MHLKCIFYDEEARAILSRLPAPTVPFASRRRLEAEVLGVEDEVGERITFDGDDECRKRLVENAAQAEFLRSKGCDLVQGFHFSRPLNVAACTALLVEQAPR